MLEYLAYVAIGFASGAILKLMGFRSSMTSFLKDKSNARLDRDDAIYNKFK
jgi:hypothetical protein